MLNLRYIFKNHRISKKEFINVIIILAIFSFLICQINNSNYSKRNDTIYSSVWCYSTNFGKRCSFNNLCYNPKLNNFLFIVNNQTIISGISSKNDLKKLSTSWLDHSSFYLKLAIIDKIENFQLVSDTAIIMSRFKPDNIMHVIHDDLLPLYFTYSRICLGNIVECQSNFILVFLDHFTNNRFSKLYNIFSVKTPIYVKSLKTAICFSKAHIGIDADTAFYQYGYGKSQGPMTPNLSGEFIVKFSQFILDQLKIKRMSSSKCTLIERISNRKILNAKFIVELIKDLHLKNTNKSIVVKNTDINSRQIEDTIRLVASSKLLLGMHGAGMILSIFLPPGSTVIELFPYGISKEHVSPLYSLSKVSNIHFKYMSWTNKNKNNSLTHPEYPRLLGGLLNASEYIKEQIAKTTFVPPVHCCHDPLYLHFMYQDTFVDYTFIKTLNRSFVKKSFLTTTNSRDIYKLWYYPSSVENLKCSYNGRCLEINWEPPCNVNAYECLYKISLAYSGGNSSSTYKTKSHMVKYKITFKDKLILVWVQCIIDGIEGIDSHVACR